MEYEAMSNKTVVVYGPAGSGKTHYAQALARHFGLGTIVEGWNGRSKLPATGVLALTNADIKPDPAERRVYRIDAALKAAGIAGEQRNG
jgi:MoxR-like ATPase